MMEPNMKKTSRDAPLSLWRRTKMNALHTFKMASPTIIADRPAPAINVIEKLQQDVNHAIRVVTV